MPGALYGLPTARPPSLVLLGTALRFDGGTSIPLSTAPARTSIQIAALAGDSGGSVIGCTQTGWIWRQLGGLYDSALSQWISVWMGLPDVSSQESGTTIAWSSPGVSYPSIVVGEFAGRLRGDVMAVTTKIVTASSVAISAPDPPVPGCAGIASAAFSSGGLGIILPTDPIMKGVGVAGLGALRVGNHIGRVTTTFSASRSSGWTAIFLLVR